MGYEEEKIITPDKVGAKRPRLKGLATFLSKGTPLLIGIGISALLYFRCMFDQYTNPIVVTYFAIIGLSCFEIVGLPVSKLSHLTAPKV